MGRPKIDDDLLGRLEATVDRRTKTPAKHLTTAQRLAFVLDELEEADNRVEYLDDRVDSLEEELEAARADSGPTTRTDGVDLDLGRNGPGGLGR